MDKSFKDYRRYVRMRGRISDLRSFTDANIAEFQAQRDRIDAMRYGLMQNTHIARSREEFISEDDISSLYKDVKALYDETQVFVSRYEKVLRRIGNIGFSRIRDESDNNK